MTTIHSVNKVIVLQSGYSREDAENPNAMRANCTCTLIRCRDGTNVIVDTMTSWDGEHLKSLLAKEGLEVNDIHIVVCTHGHSDHIGCNYLFQAAGLHLVGACASYRDLYMDHFGSGNPDEELKLDKNGEVVVQRTPGHTLSCVSVIVDNTETERKIGITGDLFERVEDVEDQNIWLDAGSEDEKQQRVQRSRIAELCDYIVPGHGPIFAVDDRIRDKLKEDMKKE
ncbi:uncharacterized protein Dwil_GK15398 [Drosophila willistoni]|uniref:Metallo-beta-lactamase domain-containing protein 1 n=1 Tax=Drosophila willistoni TaxID=7260 RepID=B4MUY4_DROWI|nr:metallo-beta-lactamase domain-containing protein 1 [Drosophila willistoni]EDW76329.1 uncharacterized protein Dwil_GK15398 [Drosophila willistoni]